ncbi:hypothetical protein Droror1_Dr00025348 [Drosera rotundifolia]
MYREPRMGELNCDLQAIIEETRSNDGASMLSMMESMETSCSFSSLGIEDYYLDERATSFLDELDQLYNPFLLDYDAPPLCFGQVEEEAVKDEEGVEDRAKLKEKQLSSLYTLEDREAESAPRTRMPRKSKNKVKVVYHSMEDSLVADNWNWRKYGQKPIKGSPYPRSYYRCSSSVGCQAKKQVEQSGLDPRTYIVTYIFEHSHPFPSSTRHSNHAASRIRNS